MAAKLIQVSDDSGSNWYTLPGNTGEWNDEAGELEDTIFGQTYKSGQSNLINWSVTSNAVYKGFAGYTVDIKQSGTSTTMTTEASTLVSGKTYLIDDTAKVVFDHTATFVVYDNAVDHTADLDNIDFLFGTVTFLSAYTVTGAVTIDGKYHTMTALAKYRNFTLTQTMEPIDTSDIPAVQANSGHRTFDQGLRTVGLETSGVFATANGYRAALVARTELVIEINPDGGGKSVARGLFKPTSRGQSGNIGELEEENVSFTLSVPTTALLSIPFGWVFTATDLSTSVVKTLEAWQDETDLDVRYLSDGTNGLTGLCVVADVSLSGGLESMNEFSCTYQGTGAVAAVP